MITVLRCASNLVRSKRRNFRIPAILLFFSFLACLAGNARADGDADAVGTRLRHAQTYYWIALAEQGNMQAFSQGLSHVDAAEKLLAKSNFDPAARATFVRRMKALREDLVNQRDMCFDTLYGVFPLTRLLVPSLFSDPLATGTYELVDDPAVMASTAAGSALALDVIGAWSSRPQLDVVFMSVPGDPALENELRYIFNTSSKFFVHTAEEVASALDETQERQFRSGLLTTPMLEKLYASFGISQVLAVTLRKFDEVDRTLMYVVEGRLYESPEEQPAYTFYNMGFSRDRRGQFLSVVWAHILLFVLSVVLYSLYLRLGGGGVSIPMVVGISTIGFLAGRVIPDVLMPLLGAIAPDPETLAVLSFWWACLAGLVVLAGPPLACRIAGGRLPEAVAAQVRENTGGLFAVVALGAGAYLAGPLFMLLENQAWLFLGVVSVCGALLLFMAGKSLESRASLSGYPVWAAAFAGLICLGFAAAVTHLSLGPVWGCLGLSAAAVCFFEVRSRHLLARNVAGDADCPDCGDLPEDCEQLMARCETPPYVPLESVGPVFEKAQRVLDGRNTRVLLCGEAGVGKTALATAVVAHLRQAAGDGGAVILLRGDCPEMVADGTGTVAPYAPFRKALSAHFGINVLQPPGEQLRQLDSALDGLFDAVIPFSGLLFPSSGEGGPSTGSRTEMFMAVKQTLEKLSARAVVVLFVDDAHWMDEASRNLFAFLLENIPEDEPGRLLMLVTSRLASAVPEMADGAFALGMPTGEDQARILSAGLGLASTVIQPLAKRVGMGTGDRGGLFWLFRLVRHLAEQGYLVKSPSGFAWSDLYEGGDKLPLPSDFKDSLAAQLASAPEFGTILACAACIGPEFSATLLADSLGMERLALLELLDTIESRTGIVYDVRESDDIYAFRSSFMLEVLREKMRVDFHGPRSSEVPQVIREFHARLARTLEAGLETAWNPIYEVAGHYYAAGSRHAQKGLEYCLKASETARRDFLFGQARRFLEMAAECAEAAGRPLDTVDQMLRIDCDEAHVQGIDKSGAAAKIRDFLAGNDSAGVDLLILAARTCYDAAAASGDQQLFAETVGLGQRICAQAQDPIARAEGFHFIGLGTAPAKSSEKRDALEEAVNLLENLPQPSSEARALLGRVYNSMAVQLSYGTAEDKALALSCFLKSKELKEGLETRDLPGLARVHGGMGWLAFFSDPPDMETARFHFAKDLEISEKIGDRAGQAKMHSALGGCDLKMRNAQAASGHYEQSLELAEDPMDKAFAVTGLFEALDVLGHTERMPAFGAQLSAVLMHYENGRLPASCGQRLAAVLSKQPLIREDDQLARCLEILKRMEDGA